MRKAENTLLIALALVATSNLAWGDIVEVALVNRLNGNQNNYCIDTVGARENAKPEEGLQAYTCYSYQDFIGFDQAMDSEAISNGQFLMTGFNVCMEARGTTAGSKIWAQDCDGNAMQAFELRPDQTIRLKTAESLCLSVGDDTRYGRGGPTGHQYKDLTLEECSEERSAYQRWYMRDSMEPNGTEASADFAGDVLVGRPTDQGAAISVMSFSEAEVYVEHGSVPGQYTSKTSPQVIGADQLGLFEIGGLESDADYFYRVRFRTDGSSAFGAGSEYSFNTARSAGSTFNFAVQADPHLGARTRFEKWCGDRCLREAADDKIYAITAANMLDFDPDFVVDLGDTFMTAQNHQNGLFAIQERKARAPITEQEVISDVRYLRELFEPVGSSVPIMLVQGNHEAEDSARLDGTPDNLAVWAVNNRKKYFPSPTDNGFYSGSTTEYEFIGRQDGYYSWQWGNALFVALDPFWVDAPRDPWSRTLGREQYDWLKNTLEDSEAAFKFVFIHHLVGGMDNPYGSSRGGALYSDYFEWGGRTPDDIENWSRDRPVDTLPGSGQNEQWPLRRVDSSTESYDFDEQRPGWGAPIQQLLLDNNVQIVFHGHDHHYAKEVHDNGIIYQEVPQPSRAGEDTAVQQLMRSARRQGYDTERGVIIANSGFLNVSVAPDQVTVEYVKNIENCTQEPCREIADRYTILAESDTGPNDHADQEPISTMSAPGIERSIVHIKNDIFRYFDNHHSSLFMLTDSGAVLVDPLNIDAAEWVKGEIKSKFGKSVTHVLYSHGHADHASGAAVFENAEVISHENTVDVVNGPDVLAPTQTYSGGSHSVVVDGREIQMHFVGGNHAADMSYILFPEDSLVFYVDVISLGALPFGELPWYSLEDSQNTYDVALSIDAEIAVPSHGPVGTQEDVRALRDYMALLRESVAERIDDGQSLEQIQETLLLEDYADWDFYEERRPQNIAGMHRALLSERAN